ncbi:MAG: hypothetical protein Kow0098_08250 [Ignavibacteriaceae bacterium]
MKTEKEIKKFFQIERNESTEIFNTVPSYNYNIQDETLLSIKHEEWEQEYFLIYRSYFLDRKD